MRFLPVDHARCQMDGGFVLIRMHTCDLRLPWMEEQDCLRNPSMGDGWVNGTRSAFFV